MRSVIAALMVALALVSSPASAQIESRTGKIASVDATAGGNFAFRVVLSGTGFPTMCNGGQTFAYLEPTDSNYEVMVSTLLTAFAGGKTVLISSEPIIMGTYGTFCHIVYVGTAA